MAGNRSTEIENLIMRLLNEGQEVSIRSVAKAAGFSRDDETKRKAIRRALLALEKRQVVVPKGAGRARVYISPTATPLPEATAATNTAEGGGEFKDIFISAEARTLLGYVSQAIQARMPVAYNHVFLRTYRPNETFYLSLEQREALLSAGRVEIKTRPAGTYARDILNRLLIDLSWNSSRLEGNTYSMIETKRLIELGEVASGKDAIEAQMILNHKAAIEYIVESSAENAISSHDVCSIHALLSENLLGDPTASGRIRRITVGIGGTTYIPLDNPHVIKECFDLFIEKINQIEDPFEQSLFALVHLSYMQAFEDVNKRTARLVANISLIRKNLIPLSFIDVNQGAYTKALLGVYEKNDVSLIRDLYIWAYTRSSKRYTAVQQSMSEPNLLKLKYRMEIQNIIRGIILEKVEGSQVVSEIKKMIEVEHLPESDRSEVFKLIETEIMSLHDGNIARFKIRPSEFRAWKERQ